jgi:hypothetical protein
MRCLLSSVAACLLLSGSARAFAQDADPATSKYEKSGSTAVTKKVPRLRSQPRVVVSPESAARLIHERAMMQARMRRARIEARHCSGVSLMRPWVADVERPAAADWSVPAGSPWWWTSSSSRLRLQW